MLTGDNKATADVVARELRLDSAHAGSSRKTSGRWFRASARRAPCGDGRRRRRRRAPALAEAA